MSALCPGCEAQKEHSVNDFCSRLSSTTSMIVTVTHRQVGSVRGVRVRELRDICDVRDSPRAPHPLPAPNPMALWGGKADKAKNMPCML